MNYRKWLSQGTIVFALLVVMLKYQNCAPATQGALNDDSVDIIDDSTSTTALSFLEKSIHVDSEETAPIEAHGECFFEQNGATLSWALVDSESEDILQTGYTGCSAGSFTVAINDRDDLPCGKEYLLMARLGLGQAGQVSVQIDCH